MASAVTTLASVLCFLCSLLVVAKVNAASDSSNVVDITDLLKVKVASPVVVLTDSNFEHETQASTGQTTGKWFIKFYAPWCGHCKQLAPVWDELATDLAKNHSDEGIVVAKVDCTTNRGVCDRFGVRGYPTLKYIAGNKVYPYSKGARNLESLRRFVLEKYGDSGPGDPVPSPPGFLAPYLKLLKKPAVLLFGAGFASGMVALFVLQLVFSAITGNSNNNKQKQSSNSSSSNGSATAKETKTE